MVDIAFLGVKIVLGLIDVRILCPGWLTICYHLL